MFPLNFQKKFFFSTLWDAWTIKLNTSVFLFEFYVALPFPKLSASLFYSCPLLNIRIKFRINVSKLTGFISLFVLVVWFQRSWGIPNIICLAMATQGFALIAQVLARDARGPSGLRRGTYSPDTGLKATSHSHPSDSCQQPPLWSSFPKDAPLMDWRRQRTQMGELANKGEQGEEMVDVMYGDCAESQALC